jgi:hypothetical protein
LKDKLKVEITGLLEDDYLVSSSLESIIFNGIGHSFQDSRFREIFRAYV